MGIYYYIIMSVAKNTTLMTIASIGQKIIAFIYFAVIANFLGVGDTGRYTTVLAFTTIIVVFVDLGLSNVLVREVARKKEQAQAYLSTVLASKIVLSICSYLLLVILVNVLGYDMEYRHMVYLSGVTMLFDSLHLSLYSVLRGYGILKHEARGIILSQAITLIFGTTFLYLGFPIIFLILAFTIASFVNVLYIGTILKKTYELSLVPVFDKKIFKHLSRIAVPFAFAAIFARVYSYIDGLLLKSMLGDIAAGLYAIPMKITFAFQFIPFALVASLYPRMSEYFTSNKKRLAQIFHQGLVYLSIVAFPIAVGIAVLAKDIILLIYTEDYIASVVPLQILMTGLVFFFLSFPIGACLNACNRQATQTGIAGVVMLINIGLNIMLIPIYGIIGASIAALVGNVLLVVIGFVFVRKVLEVAWVDLLKKIIQIGFSAFIMGWAVYMVSSHVPLVIAILFGAVIYPFMLMLTKGVEKRHIEDVVGLLR